jgi:N-acetylmuramoyl-L-alanine amidase
MRFGPFAPGTSRVVLDLKRPGRLARAFVLPPQEGLPHRLVMDIVPTSRAKFRAGEGRETILSDPPLAPVQTAVLAAPKARSDRRPTIVVDPGHGGIDPGARSINGHDEKAIVLDYARELERQLKAVGRYRVIVTRRKDVFIPLRDRVTFAQESEGDLFVSLHANNHESARIRGASIYTLSEHASDAEAAALAARENKADIIGGMNLSDQTPTVSKILIDLAQRETMNLSKRFANGLVKDLGSATRLLANSHRFAGFAVLKSPVVPSVLLEIGHLSHPKEEPLLRSAKHRKKVVAAVVSAIDGFFSWRQSFNQ